jgi:SNF2 family DNA or RNA helicase
MAGVLFFMLVLHAAFLDRRLYLWGERTPEKIAVRKTKRGRPAGIAKPQSFPYDAGGEVLIQAVRQVAPGVSATLKQTGEMQVWLPASQEGPWPSSPLIASVSDETQNPQPAPFLVTALALNGEATVHLLCACAGRELLASGIVAGADLTFWAYALHLAGALVLRQQYLPSIRNDETGYFACWEPVCVGRDAEQMRSLARQMPAVARALTAIDRKPGKSAPRQASVPDVSASSVLQAFLQVVLDHLVRASADIAGLGVPAPAKTRGKKWGYASVHDEWLRGLRSNDGCLLGDPEELTRFAEEVRAWSHPVRLTASAPFRLCFRLDEPAGESHETAATDTISEAVASVRAEKTEGEPQELWRVHFFLQGQEDRSLLLPVREVWRPKRKHTALLGRGGFNAREYLLSALGQASSVCSGIAASLSAAEPEGYTLDAVEAHEFLTRRAPALEQAGFGVLLPAWWSRRGTKTRLKARGHIKTSATLDGTGLGKLSLDALVQFQWDVALGDKTLTERELHLLANLKAPLVKIRGQWVELNAEEIRQALAFWKKRRDTLSLREALHVALGAAAPIEQQGIEFDSVQAEGWMDDLLRQLDSATPHTPVPIPEGLNGELRPYQERGFSWLVFLRRWGLGACLADDMGLGKTIQTLTLFLHNQSSSGKPVRPTLVVCPTSVVHNWRRETQQFTPGLSVMVHHGTERKKGAAFLKQVHQHQLVLTSYGLLQRDTEALQQVEWDGVVLDEAQNIKNPETKQARAARSLRAAYRIALTGTPVENHVGDLWSIMEFLNPGLLGTQTDFRRHFLLPIQASRDTETAERLKKLTAPFILRRLKSDKSIIQDLPEKQEMKVFCNLTKEQTSLYAAVLQDLENGLERTDSDIQRNGIVLATLAKLKQVCNHPAQFLGDNSAIPDRSGKLARLCEMIEEILEVKDRALIFTQFAEMGTLLQRHLQDTFGRECFFLHGGTPKTRRDRMVERFQSDDGPSLFILSIRAGGTGLNLTRANHVFHYDRWWNPAVENQATDRAYRIGQKRNVQVHKFICAGTLEENIDALIESKKAIAEDVVGTGEGWLTKLSNRDLKRILALSKDAVGD